MKKNGIFQGEIKRLNVVPLPPKTRHFGASQQRPKLSDEECEVEAKKLMEDIDLNHDGEIDYYEFLSYSLGV